MDYNKLYSEWLDTALGKRHIEWLYEEYYRQLEKAGESKTPEEAFGHLKTANGIIIVINYLKTHLSVKRGS